MQLHKIRQYNFIELVRILSYRVLYQCKVATRRCIVALFKPCYKAIPKQSPLVEQFNRITSSLYAYYGFLNCDKKRIIEEAEFILSGKTVVFSHSYSFNPQEDWLKDLETGNYWPRDVFWDKARFVENGLADVKYVLEVNKLNDIVSLALAYYVSQDEKYVHYVDEYLQGWLKCVPLEKSVVNKIVMDFGFRVINLIHISLLCHNSQYFKEIVHPHVLGIIKQHVQHIWSYLSSRWFKSRNDNNHNVGEIVGLYIGQLWLKRFGNGGGYLLDNQINKELSYLQDVTERLVAKSGCYLEQSANYTRVVHDFFLMFELFRHALDYNRDFGWFDKSGYLEKLSNYLLDISYHGQLPNFGDNDYARIVIPFEDKNDVVSHVRMHCQEKREMGAYTADGQWLYRSKDKNDVFLFCRVGKFSQFVEGAFIHAHNDLLAVIISAKGKQVFIDKGTLFYNSGLEIRQDFTSTGAHNTVQIGNEEMASFLPIGYSNYPQSSLLESIREDNHCRFVGEVSYKDIRHQRTISYSGEEVVIEDELTRTSAGKETGTIRFVLAEDVKPEEGSDGILLKDSNDNSTCTVAFQGVAGWKVKETAFAPHYALRKRTSLIEATFDLINNITIKTFIKIA